MEDTISISQFEELTGLSRQGVITAIEKAIAVGAIARTPDKRNGFKYRLVNDVDQSEQSSTLTSTRSGLDLVNDVDQSTPQLVNDVDTQKKDLKEKKERVAAPPRKRALASLTATQADLLETPLSIYRQVTNVRSPNQAQRELIETVDDLDLWRATCEQFAVAGWNVRNVQNMLENYTKRANEKKRHAAQVAARQASYTNGTNGHHAPERMPTPEETAAAARLYRPRIPGRTAE